MKKIFTLFIISMLICACSSKASPKNKHIVSLNPEKIPSDQLIQDNTDKNSFSFADLDNLQFTFSSGAGGWATLLTIDSNGIFSGEFFDGEMGSACDDYPNGTTYQCIFKGIFSSPVKINDYTYSVGIQEITYEQEIGTEEIIDGMLYCYSTPYGIEGAEEFYIYLPGAPLDQLPDEFLSWVGTDWNGNHDISAPECTELPFYGFYNAAEQCGFSSYNILENFENYFQSVEEWGNSVEESLQNDPLNQLELNEKSHELYMIWDSALNQVWDMIRKTMDDEQAWDTLLQEQREWISMKENAVEEAGKEYEGGSIQGLVMNQKAAELTKARVYELKDILMQ